MVQNIIRLVHETNPNFLFVPESKIINSDALMLKCRLNFFNCFCVNHVGLKGGLILFWNVLMNISILSYSIGHIDCFINSSPNPLYFTGFYGSPTIKNHPQAWNLLNRIAATHTNSHLGWLVDVDFNEILYDHEKKGGNSRTFTQMSNFRDALLHNSLTSLDTSAPSSPRTINIKLLIRYSKDSTITWQTLSCLLLSPTTAWSIWISSALTTDRF